MSKLRNKNNFLALLLVIVPFLILITSYITTPPVVYAAQSRVGLGTANDFAVLAGSGITNTGATTITGNVGTFPTTTETGFAGLVTLNGVNHVGDAVTQGAKNDLVTAYNDAAGRTPVTTRATDLAGATLTAGVYDSEDTTFSITGGGTLTLDGGGNADAVFIFKMGTTLITSPSSKVVLIGSAQACNVYWQVGSSATLDTSTNFIGNILALTSITLNTSATVNGRVLARNGAVTMDTNTITRADCAAGSAGAPAAGSTSVLVNDTTSVPTAPYCPSFSCVTPIILESRRVDADSIFLSWGPYTGMDQFSVQYGVENGKWLYSTNVTGFSTTLNGLPLNQPIWVLIQPRNNCSVGPCGVVKLVGGPKLPNTGFGFQNNNPWNIAIPVGVVAILLTSLGVILEKRKI